MNSLQITRGKARYKRTFAAMRAAKGRHRVARGEAELPDEPPFDSNIKPAKFATVTIRCGAEAVSFRVLRFDERRSPRQPSGAVWRLCWRPRFKQSPCMPPKTPHLKPR